MFLLRLPLTAKLFLGVIIGSMAAVWAFAKSGPRQDAAYDFLTIGNDDGARDDVIYAFQRGTLEEKMQVGEWLRQNGYDEAARHFPG